MKKERAKLPRSEKPIPLRIPPELMVRIRFAAQALGLPISEVIRLATSIGLERLRRIDYDLARAVNDAAEPGRVPSLRVADEPELPAMKAKKA